jgi:hypothetical protein
MFALPLRPDLAHYRFRCALDGRTYTFEVRFNERDGAHRISVGTESGAPIVQGVRVVLEWPLLRRYRDVRLFPGDLIAIDTASEGREPGFGELGDRVLLLYLAPDEIAEVAA